MTFAIGFILGVVVGVGSLVAVALWRQSSIEKAVRIQREGRVT